MSDEQLIVKLEALAARGWDRDEARALTFEYFDRALDECREWFDRMMCVTHVNCQDVAEFRETGDGEIDTLGVSQMIIAAGERAAAQAAPALPEADDARFDAAERMLGVARDAGDIVYARWFRVAQMCHPATFRRGMRAEADEHLLDIRRTTMTLHALNMMYCDEKAALAAGRPAADTHTLEEAYAIADRLIHNTTLLHPPDRAAQFLDDFVGGYLADLDLSRSYVTGSAAMSAVLSPEIWWRARYGADGHGALVAALFPPVCTGAADPAGLAAEIASRYGLTTCHRRTHDGGRAPRVVATAEGGTVEFDDASWPFALRPGADVNIVVDAISVADNSDDFDAIAERHAAAICARFPTARVSRSADGTWRVAAPSLAESQRLRFPAVTIRAGTWTEVCRAPLGMTRLAYTAAGGGAPRFELATSCLLAAIYRSSPDYIDQYDASPVETVLKYTERGYAPVNTLPKNVRRALVTHAGRTTKWRDHFLHGQLIDEWGGTLVPTLRCSGNYSLFSLPDELKSQRYVRGNIPMTGDSDGDDDYYDDVARLVDRLPHLWALIRANADPHDRR